MTDDDLTEWIYDHKDDTKRILRPVRIEWK